MGFQFLIGRLQTTSRSQQTKNIPSSFNSSQVGYKLDLPKSMFMLFLGFNSSQVGYKRCCWCSSRAICSRFQFLIGRLQTSFTNWVIIVRHYGFNSSQVGYKPGCLFGTWRSACLVSIPHRQATNDREYINHLILFRFQFLIGRLQTLRLSIGGADVLSFNSSQVGYKRIPLIVLKSTRSQFQFLIGRLQTKQPPPQQEDSISFQFLIGRLQTVGNTITANTTITKFQFLIGRLQTENPIMWLIFDGNAFQFLIGRLQTWAMDVQDKLWNCSFNSSQVGYKH